MERKHFVTVGQTVLTKVISITLKKETLKKKTTKYNYLIVKLPATFKSQVVTLWNPRTKFGIKKIATNLGGSGLIRLGDDPETKGKFKLNDVLTASFSDSTVKLD